LHAPLRQPRHGPLLCGLALTRVIGWGSTFYAPSVLVTPIGRDLGVSPEVVFGGITILLVTGALLGPAIGRHLDQHGTRRSMCVGALICALGLAAIAMAQGPVSYLASWFVIGIGHAMTLANVGNVTVAQLMGDRARRTIGIMMLATGLASSVFWPLAAALTEAYGWRACWLVFAALQIVVVLPIHACIPAWHRAGPEPLDRAAEEPVADEQGRVAPADRKAVFRLLALTFSASGLISWGLPLHLISLLQTTGMSQATAVGLATLSGPATLMARAVDALAGERLAVERVALLGLALGPLSCLVMAFAPGSVALAAGFIVCFSAAMGVISVARATLPLALFGRRGFGTMLGRLAVPQNLAFAAAPLLFAVLMERLGPQATLLVSAAVQAMAFLAMLVLVGRLRA
jgi:predicted MFS family arabinose efflux permease